MMRNVHGFKLSKSTISRITDGVLYASILHIMEYQVTQGYQSIFHINT